MDKYLFLTHEQVFFLGQQEVEERLAIIDCEEAWVYKAVLGIFQFSFRFQDMPLNFSCFQNGAYSLMNELVVYRRVSHGFGWPANAILFLPIVKGNQKLRNTTAPTASNSKKSARNNYTWFPFHPIERASHDLVIVDNRQGKKLLFANSVVKKSWRWLATKDHAKLVYTPPAHSH